MPDIKCNPDDQFCSYISTEENMYGIGCTSDKNCFIIPFDGSVSDSTGFVQLNCKYNTGHQNYIYLIHVMMNCSRDTHVSICKIRTSPQKSGKISKTKYLPKDMHNILMCRKCTENAWSSFIRFFYGNLSMRYFRDLYFTLWNKTAFQAHHLIGLASFTVCPLLNAKEYRKTGDPSTIYIYIFINLRNDISFVSKLSVARFHKEIRRMTHTKSYLQQHIEASFVKKIFPSGPASRCRLIRVTYV